MVEPSLDAFVERKVTGTEDCEFEGTRREVIESGVEMRSGDKSGE